MVRMQSLQSAASPELLPKSSAPSEPGALEEGAGRRVPVLLQGGHTEALVSIVAMRSRFPTEASLTPTLAVPWRTCSKPSFTPLILTLAVMCNSSMSTSTALPTQTLLPCRKGKVFDTSAAGPEENSTAAFGPDCSFLMYTS
jgi:hypothetical protein